MSIVGRPREPDTSANRLPLIIGVGAFVAAMAVFCIHIGRPAYWEDEAFTVELTRRDWYQLARLIYHVEAPLGPYYTVMKPWLAVSRDEWWARLPSAIAMALGTGLLAHLVARVLGAAAAVAAATALILLPEVSRYAQEARPYGIALFLGVVASVAWWQCVTRPSVRHGLMYALTVLLLPLAQLLALTVVLAQLASTPWAAPPGKRVRTTLVATGWAAVGGLVASPFIVLAIKRAVGVGHPLASSLHNDWLTVVETFGTDRVALVMLALSVIGLAGALRRARVHDGGGTSPHAQRSLIVLALVWGLVPMVVLCLAAAAGQKTLLARYFLVALPGWAVLAGYGTTVLGGCVAALIRRRTVGRYLGIIVPLAAIAIVGLNQQQAIRTPAGHSYDVRPAIAFLRSPAERGDAVVVPGVAMVPPVIAYDPDLIGRMPLYRNPDGQGALLLVSSRSPKARARLARYRRIAVVVQGDVTLADFYGHHVPGARTDRIVALWSSSGWSIAVLQRSLPSFSHRPRPPASEVARSAA